MAKKDSATELTEITPLPVEIDEKSVTEDNTTYEYELIPGVVTVDEKELHDLITQNLTMKTEIGQLVSLFKNFEGLISGKGIGSLMMTLPKLINNPEVGAQISAIAPIIEKYNTTP